MFVIGLTGGIASGKSTVSRMLAELGAPIVDADEIAREVVRPDQPLWRAVTERFGAAILRADCTLDREKLGALIFHDARARADLNAILHPGIEAEALRALDALRARGAAAAVLDVPLLLEVGWQRHADAVWVVYVDGATQLRRLMARNALLPEAAAARIASQLPLAEKIKSADVVIDNSGDLSHTRRQVEAQWRILAEGGKRDA